VVITTKMKVLSVIFLLVLLSMVAEAQWFYPYSYGYYPYYYSYYPYYWGKRSESSMEEVNNRTECVYVQNDHIFKCKGPLGEVECDAKWIMDESIKIEMFGIGKPMDDSKSINLYRRDLKNTKWMSNIVRVKDEDHKITLHQGESKDFGLSVQDETCFDKVLDLFGDSTRDEKIHLTDTNSSVHILGDFSLLIRKKFSFGKYSDEEETDMDDEEEDDEMNEIDEDEFSSVEKRARYGRGRYGYGRGRYSYGSGRYSYGRGRYGYGRGRYGYGRGRYGK